MLYRASKVEFSPSIDLAQKVLDSPIKVPQAPPQFDQEIATLRNAQESFPFLPATILAMIAFSPIKLETMIRGLVASLMNVKLETQGAEISGQHVLLFGLPNLMPGKEKKFKQVIKVANQLGKTHEQLIYSAKIDGEQTAESICLMQNLLFCLFKKTLAVLFKLTVEANRLKETKLKLSSASPYKTIRHNHLLLLPVVVKRLQEIETQVGGLSELLARLGNLEQALGKSKEILDYALNQKLVRPSLIGG